MLDAEQDANQSSLWRQVSMRQALLSVIHGFGPALSKEVIFWAE